MNLVIQIKDNEYKDAPIGISNKNKNIENVRSILSQNKTDLFTLFLLLR